MATQRTNHAAQLYQDNPAARHQALSRLSAITYAIRRGDFEDPYTQMPEAANHVARSEFASTLNYMELLQHTADESHNDAWQEIADEVSRETTERIQTFTNTIADLRIPHEDAVERLHNLSLEDYNARMHMIMTCPSIYRDSRVNPRRR